MDEEYLNLPEFHIPPPRVTIAWLQHSEQHEFIWHAYGSTRRTDGMSGATSAGWGRGLRRRVWWRGRVEDGSTSHRWFASVRERSLGYSCGIITVNSCNWRRAFQLQLARSAQTQWLAGGPNAMNPCGSYKKPCIGIHLLSGLHK